jgi:crotonobetainyl-CoA:carnitine CoA-transferase CaiB-like acyl-CoA transferase
VAPALAYAGKLFADFGAEVWKLPDAEGSMHEAWPLGRGALGAVGLMNATAAC